MAWPRPILTVTHIRDAIESAKSRRVEADDETGNYQVHHWALSEWFVRQRGQWTAESVVLGCLAVYGWMPTILESKKKPGNKLTSEKAKCIAEALNDGSGEFDLTFVNCSVVGTSKFLHFAFPHEYPIWDSRVRRALVGRCVITDPIEEYRQYRTAMKTYAGSTGLTLRQLEQQLFWSDKFYEKKIAKNKKQ